MAYGTVNADVIGTSVANSNLGAGNATRFKNRIINGDMRIDQRNAGASVTQITAGAFVYTLDRWSYYGSQTSKYTVQQDAGAITPPIGFSDYLGVTSSSAYSIISSDLFLIRQAVEGFNCADFGWGTANAKTITLSFWVRSSLTGTFGGAIGNSAGNRQYPFSYTISSANTWEQKSITIAGDTTGTWLTTNGIGLSLYFSLGTGSTYSGTAGVWGTSAYSATGATSVVGTSGATFYITGVQLEVGSSATGFEYVDYTTQLAMCQRYYEKHSSATGNLYTSFAMMTATSSTNAEGYIQYLVEKRTSPTFSISTLYAGDGTGGGGAVTSLNAGYRGTSCALIQVVASGLTTFRPYNLLSNNSATAYVDFSSEL